MQTRSGREQLSARHLTLRGYEVFLPTYQQDRRWSDRIKHYECALFPGYLFCRSDGTLTGKCVTVPGVIRILSDAQGPIPVPPEEIAAIQRIGDRQVPAAPWPFLIAGQRVRVDAGPLSGIEGIVLRVKGQHRLIVSIPLLQRSVAIEIGAERLISVGSAPRTPARAAGISA